MLLRVTKDECYKTHFKENKKKKNGTVWKANTEIINAKSTNDVPINSQLIGEIITTNAKRIANHFNISLMKIIKSLIHCINQIKLLASTACQRKY